MGEPERASRRRRRAARDPLSAALTPRDEEDLAYARERYGDEAVRAAFEAERARTAPAVATLAPAAAAPEVTARPRRVPTEDVVIPGEAEALAADRALVRGTPAADVTVPGEADALAEDRAAMLAGRADDEARRAALEVEDAAVAGRDADLAMRFGVRPGPAAAPGLSVPLPAPEDTLAASLAAPPPDTAAIAERFSRRPEPRRSLADLLSLAPPTAPGPAANPAPAPAPAAAPGVDPLEEALYARAAGLPPVTAGAALPSPTDPLADALSPAPRLWEPRPSRPRRGGGGRVATPAPALTEDELLIEALTGRPRDAPSLVPYDQRTETGLDRDLRLNADSTRIETRRAELAGMAAAEQRDVFEAQLRAQQELEAERRTAVASAQQSFRHFADRAASLTIDPDGFYHSRGVGGTIASAIAIGLGGLSSAINGGPNVALDMINSEIERDLMAQQQRIESAFRRADAEGTLYDMARQEYQDRSAALEASRALALDNVAATVAEDASRLGSEEARVNGEVMAAQLRDAANAARAEAERAEMEWQLNMQLLDACGRREAARADQDALRASRMAGGGGPPAPSPVTEREMNAYNRALDSGMDPEEAALTAGIDPRVVPRGGRRFAEGSGDAAAGTVAAISSALDTIEALIPGGLDSEEDIPGVGLVDNAVPDLLTSEEGQSLREELANATELFGRLHSGAAITDEEFALFTRIIRGANTEAALRRGIRRIRREIEARTSPVREGRGLEDVEADSLSDLGAREVTD